MNRRSALSFLDSLVNYELVTGYDYHMSCGLRRIEKALSIFRNPHRGHDFIVVCGTKGKGSTAAMLSSILTSAGLKTGTFFSPHLVSIRERIRVNNRYIDEVSFLRHLGCIKKMLQENRGIGLTFFEVMTLLAFLHFQQEKIEIGVLEVGLGGRLDATNVVRPLVSALTPISYDHMHLLGASLDKIAKEKAGVIKDGLDVVSAPQETEALRVIKGVVRDKKARLFMVGKDIRSSNIEVSLSGTHFDAKTWLSEYKALRVPMIGRHQAINAMTALGVIEVLRTRFLFDIKRDNIRDGLASVDLPGRFDIVSRSPYIILDGAQNRRSAESLRATYSKLFAKRGCILIIGISSDKDIDGIGRVLCPMADIVIFTRAASVRAADPQDLASKIGRFCKRYYTTYDIEDSLAFAKRFTGREDVILVTGSLFLLGDTLRSLGYRG